MAKYAWMNAVTATGDTNTPFAGTVKESKLADAFQINLEGIEGVKLEYSVHNRTIGWSDWMSEGQIAGYVQPDNQFGSKDIKDWKQAEAIKITVVEGLDKLKAAGYEIRYRVHLGYDGWEKEWTVADDSKTVINKRTENSQTGKDANGNKVIAGSVGWSRRIEALQVMLVKTKTTLNDVKAEALEKLEKYEEFMAANKDEHPEYTALLESLESTEYSIQNASSEQAVKSAVDAILSAMSDVEKEMKELDEKKQEAVAELQKYIDVLSKVDGLDSADKTKIKSFINKEKDAINAADKKADVTSTLNAAEAYMGATFEKVELAKVKTETVNALNDYLKEAKPGMEKVIKEAIENVEKAENKAKVEEAIGDLLDENGGLPTLKEQQKLAYEKLDAYEDYLAKNEVEDEEAILREIATVRAQIDSAEDAEGVTNAMSEFDNFMNEDKYQNTDAAIELDIAKNKLADKYAKYSAELAPYLTMTDKDTKEVAEKAKELMKAIAEPETAFENATVAETAATKLDELWSIGRGDKNWPTEVLGDANKNTVYKYPASRGDENSTNFMGFKKVLEHNKQALDNIDKADKAARAKAYEDATKKLNVYETVLKDVLAVSKLELTNTDISNIQGMIDATKSSIEKAEGKNGIDEAMSLLDGATGYLAKYYEDYLDYAKDYDLNHTRDAALAELEGYETKYKDVTAVQSAITTAESNINGATTATQVETEMETVRDAVELADRQAEVEAEKERILSKYRSIVESADVSSEAIRIANEAISKVEAVELTVVTDYDEKMVELKNLEKQYDKDLQEALDKLAQDKKTALENAKKEANTIVDEYIKIAKNAGTSASEEVKQLQEYKTKINSAQDVAGVTAQKDELLGTIAKSMPVLKEQYDVIEKVNTFYENTYAEVDEYAPYLEQIKAVINKGITDIEKINTVTDRTPSGVAKMQEEITKIVEFDSNNIKTTAYEGKATLNKALIEALSNKESLEQKKTNAKNKITAAATEAKTDRDELETAIDAIAKEYTDQIDALKATEITDAKLNEIVEKAENRIANYVKEKIVEAVKPLDAVDNTKLGEVQSQLLTKNVSDFIDGLLTCTLVSGKTDEYKLSGTLKKITDFTEFGNGADAEGNYLPLVIKNDVAKKITAELVGAKNTPGEIELKDNDNVFIAKITDKVNQKIIIRYYSDDEGKTLAKTITYDLSGLTLSPTE